jgi:lysophospholipase L1-like esterase
MRCSFCLLLAVTLGCSSEEAGAPGVSDASSEDAPAASDDAASPDADEREPEASPPDAGPTAALHFVGRFDTTDPKGPRFAWPASAIYTRFSGTGASIKLHDPGTNFFDVSIDGAGPTLLKTSSASDTYPLATGLSDGEHAVSIVRRTESFVGIVQFFDVTSTEGRPLVPTPFPFARAIEVIGDSISCGYGVLGASATCSFSDDTEDEELAYGGLAAKALNAAHTAIAYSGIGVYRNYGGDTTNTMQDRWTRTFADDAKSTWDFHVIPDVVVVNLGTNDFAKGDPGQPFQGAYLAFLKAIRARYPNAPILGALSPMLAGTSRTSARTYIESAIAAAADPKITYFEFDVQDGTNDGFGCDYHPSQTTQKKMSDKLVPAIKAVMGW